MGEKVIVRGHVGQPHNPEPVMTVAQHERIVAGFRRGVYDAVTETLMEMPENIDIHPEVIRDCIMREIDAFIDHERDGHGRMGSSRES